MARRRRSQTRTLSALEVGVLLVGTAELGDGKQLAVG